MYVRKPYAELWKNVDNTSHIAKCAKLCYASERVTNDEDFIEAKWKAGHKSVFRHGTVYFVIPKEVIEENQDSLYFSQDAFITYFNNSGTYFVSTNMQHYRESDYLDFYYKYIVDEDTFMMKAGKSYKNVAECLRRSVMVFTQVSTSRELNRTSPNNICEQSTRYCNFTQEKFNGDITICEPHWLCITENFLKSTDENPMIFDEVKVILDNADKLYIGDGKRFYNTLNEWPIGVNSVTCKDGSLMCYNPEGAEEYLKGCIRDCEEYNKLITKYQFKPEDARGKLPLDLATKVVYTYSLREWKHILDLRYYGVTGKPHLNAKIAANLIREKLNLSQAYIEFPEKQ